MDLYWTVWRWRTQRWSDGRISNKKCCVCLLEKQKQCEGERKSETRAKCTTLTHTHTYKADLFWAAERVHKMPWKLITRKKNIQRLFWTRLFYSFECLQSHIYMCVCALFFLFSRHSLVLCGRFFYVRNRNLDGLVGFSPPFLDWICESKYVSVSIFLCLTVAHRIRIIPSLFYFFIIIGFVFVIST